MTQALTGQKTTTTTPTIGRAKASDVQAKASGAKAKASGKVIVLTHHKHGFLVGDLVEEKAAATKAMASDATAAKASDAKAKAKDSDVGTRTLTPRNMLLSS